MATVRTLKPVSVDLAEIIQCLDFGVVVVSKSTGLIVQANRKCAELFGFRVEEGTLVGLPFRTLCMSPDEQERAFQPSHLEMEGFISSIVLMNVDGEPVNFDVTIVHGRESNVDCIILTLKNVDRIQVLLKDLSAKNDELDSLLKVLQRQNDQLLRVDEMKNQFISLMSHEIRTPLSGMIGYLELINNKLVDSSEQENYLKVIHQESLRLSEIVNDFLDLSKMIAGKLEFHVSELEVGEILQLAAMNMNGFAQKRKVEINVAESAILKTRVFADRGRLLQVFLNVFNNAVKFSHEKGKVKAWVEANGKDFIRVQIEDHGIGIREKDFSKVFADFEMVESLQEHHKGTGLGMPLCKRFMKAMGGAIDFKSQFGKGTTFWIDIPTRKVLDPSFYTSSDQPDSQIIF